MLRKRRKEGMKIAIKVRIRFLVGSFGPVGWVVGVHAERDCRLFDSWFKSWSWHVGFGSLGWRLILFGLGFLLHFVDGAGCLEVYPEA